MKTNSNFKKLTINAPYFDQTDTIIKYNREKTEISHLKIENNLIHYSLKISFEENKIRKYAPAQLKNKSRKKLRLFLKNYCFETA